MTAKDTATQMTEYTQDVRGQLRILLRQNATRARTILAGQYCEPPFVIQRALYCEYALPDMAYLYISSITGGILQGDCHTISVDLEEGAKAHITTQGATRIYGMGGGSSNNSNNNNSSSSSSSNNNSSSSNSNSSSSNSNNSSSSSNGGSANLKKEIISETKSSNSNSNSGDNGGSNNSNNSGDNNNNSGATQELRINAGPHTYLEFVPDQIIPYAGSRFCQSTNMTIDDTATVIYAEIISAGRIGMGESFAYESCRLRMRIQDLQNRLRFIDAANMDPVWQSTGISSFGVMNRYSLVASAYIMTNRGYVHDIQRGAENLIVHNKRVVGGATLMDNDTGVLVRLLGDDTEPIKETINRITAHVRRVVLDAPFTDIRKS